MADLSLFASPFALKANPMPTANPSSAFVSVEVNSRRVSRAFSPSTSRERRAAAPATASQTRTWRRRSWRRRSTTAVTYAIYAAGEGAASLFGLPHVGEGELRWEAASPWREGEKNRAPEKFAPTPALLHGDRGHPAAEVTIGARAAFVQIHATPSALQRPLLFINLRVRSEMRLREPYARRRRDRRRRRRRRGRARRRASGWQQRWRWRSRARAAYSPIEGHNTRAK